MARVMRSAAERRAEMAPDSRVTFVKRRARLIITIIGNDIGNGVTSGGSRAVNLQGALVRFEPVQLEDREVAAAVEFFRSIGAFAVKVLPRQAQPLVVLPSSDLPEPDETPRALVMRMAGEAITQDREALRQMLDEAMTVGKL